MTTEPENLILRKLQEMRTEIAAQFAGIAARDEKTQAQIGVLGNALNSIRAELIRVRENIGEITIAIDHHSDRLDRIEQHLGLDKTAH